MACHEPRWEHRLRARDAVLSNDYGLRKSSGGFAIFAAMRWCGPGPATGRTSNVLVRGHL